MICLYHHSVESGSRGIPASDSAASPQPAAATVTTHLPPFGGRPFDITTGLQNNQIGWYDPTPGRYLSEDPVGFDDSDENLTKYVGQGSSPDHKV